MSENNTLFLVDGSSLAFRSFFALLTTGMRNAEGKPSWAVYGFFASLFDLIEKRSPHSMAVCFDMAEPTFRHEAFEDYKAHRDEMPDDLVEQWPIIKDAVKALGIPVYELSGWEADDIIGTVAKKAMTERGLSTVILTGDQDAFQLLDDGHIQVLMPTKEGLKTYGRDEVFEKLGVWPEQVIDYKGLCGDSSDNIPGVRGIGPKTAVTLLGQYRNLEGIYEHLEEIKSASQKSKLSDGKLNAFESRDLATIRLDVPLEFDFDHCQLSLPEPEEICKIFVSLELRNLLKRLPKVLSHFNNGMMPEIDSKLLTVPSRSRIKSGAGFAPAAEKTAANQLAEVEQAAPQQGRQLSLLDAMSGTDSPCVTILESSVKYDILRSKKEIQALIDELKEVGLFALALRSSGEHAYSAKLHGISISYSGSLEVQDGRLLPHEARPLQKAVYIALEKEGEAPLCAPEVLMLFKELFENPQIGKLVYDAKFTSNLLYLAGIELKGVIFDPMLASYIINPDEKHKLEDQVAAILMRRLPELPSSQPRKASIDLDFLPVSQLAELTIEESRSVEELCLTFLKVMDEDQKELLWGMDLPTSSVLARLEQNGVKLDLPYFKALSKELASEISRLEKEIHELAGHPFNVGSPLQLQKVLFEELGLPAKVKTKSGYSTDASVLESLLNSHPIIAKIIDYRHTAKLQSTYVESLPRQVSKIDGRLHGEFNQTVTSTGRLSSTNPNLQNIPIRTELGRRIRRGFIAGDESSFLVSADYSQIELRLLAHMSGDERLIEAFSQDLDIHKRTASLIFDLPVDAIDEDKRAIGKTLNFALIYQQGAYATGQSLGISTREASSFIEKYFQSFPKVKAFMNRIIADAREKSYVQTLWGRRRYFSHLNDRNDGIRKADERAAFNAPLQGSAADLMKLAMISLQKQLDEKMMSTRLILQVHDELVLDVPENELEKAKEILLSAMKLGEPLTVPLKVDLGVGKNWMDAK